MPSASQPEKLLMAGADSVIKAADTASQGITLADCSSPDMPLIYINHAFEELTGYSAKEVIGKNCRFLQGKATEPESVDTIRKAIKSGKSCSVELMNYKKDGTPFMNRLLISPIRDDLGNVTHYAGVQTDISEIKAIEETLAGNDEGFYWSSNLFSLDLHNTVSEKLRREVMFNRLIQAVAMGANEAASVQDVLHFALNEMAKSMPFKLAHAMLLSDDGRLRSSKVWHVAAGFESKDSAAFQTITEKMSFGVSDGAAGKVLKSKEPKWHDNIDKVESSARSHFYEKMGICSNLVFPIIVRDQVKGVVEFFSCEEHNVAHIDESDVRLLDVLNILGVQLGRVVEREQVEKDRILLERQLLQSQKMEALGSFTSGISHDFNNLLTPIQLLSQLHMRNSSKGEKLHDDMRMIYEASHRGKNLIKGLLSFSYDHDTDFSTINLKSLLENSESFLRSLIPSSIELKVNVPEGDIWIHGHETQIEQILLNLCSNSVGAMKKGDGLMTISVENQNGEAILSFSDTGTGIPKALLHRIYDPFFTTKDVDEGTGLGLAVVYGIVDKHKGTIDVKSHPDDGTTFNIYLPMIHSGEKDHD